MMNPISPNFIALAVIVMAGAAVAVQASINARLSDALGGPIYAACISFAVGLIFLFSVTVLRSDLGRLLDVREAPAWALAGGLFGALFILGLTWGMPKLGSVTVLSAAIFGQLAAGLVIDRFGLFGAESIPVSLLRVVGVAVILIGVVLTSL